MAGRWLTTCHSAMQDRSNRAVALGAAVKVAEAMGVEAVGVAAA